MIRKIMEYCVLPNNLKYNKSYITVIVNYTFPSSKIRIYLSIFA